MSESKAEEAVSDWMTQLRDAILKGTYRPVYGYITSLAAKNRRYGFDLRVRVSEDYAFEVERPQVEEYETWNEMRDAAEAFFRGLSETAQGRVQLTAYEKVAGEAESKRVLMDLDLEPWRSHVRYGLWYAMKKANGSLLNLYVEPEPPYRTLNEAYDAALLLMWSMPPQKVPDGSRIEIYRRDTQRAKEDPEAPLDCLVPRTEYDKPGYAVADTRRILQCDFS